METQVKQIPQDTTAVNQPLTQKQQTIFAQKKHNPYIDKNVWKYKNPQDLKIDADAYFDKVDEKNEDRKSELAQKQEGAKRSYTLIPYLFEELLISLDIELREFNAYRYSDIHKKIVEYVDFRITVQHQQGAFTGEMMARPIEVYNHYHGLVKTRPCGVENVSGNHQSQQGNNQIHNAGPVTMNFLVMQKPEDVADYCKRMGVENLIEPSMDIPVLDEGDETNE